MNQDRPTNKGKKKRRNEKNYKRNIIKIAKNKGQKYTSHSGKSVLAKQFTKITVCCPKNCFEDITILDQEAFFDGFWISSEDYTSQNVLLSGLMTLIPNDSIKNSSSKTLTRWEYRFHIHTKNKIVCRQFLINLLQIRKGRFNTVQNKLKNNESLGDIRGFHNNHLIVLTEDIKKMILEHCLSIPHNESHYNREHSSLQYFDHPDLNITTMYKLFLEYYVDKTKILKTPFCESSYIKYFQQNVNFAFSKPRTDVCDVCYEHKNDKSSLVYKNHKQLIEKHAIVKKLMLNDKNALCMEFDFGQNLPLPKIPASEQFYRRLIWLHVFNVHVFGPHKRSYMYFFIEGNFKKGANTVCNFLFDSIKREFQLNVSNKINFFSDNCGGQNKNYLVVCFLSLLARHLQVEINHLYPVRGHSYCSCDRNFGLYGRKKKNIETIETDEEYFEIIRSARTPPFIIVKESDYSMNDYETIIPKQIKLPKYLRISDAVKITYYGNGSIDVYYRYDEKPKNYVIETKLLFDDLLKTPLAKSIGIIEQKLNDAASLMRYLSDTGKHFFERLKNSAIKCSNKHAIGDKNKQNDFVNDPKKKLSRKKQQTSM